MKKIKSIHFVGIKGVGVAPLAIIAKEAGFSISGSDIEDEFITSDSLRKAGIKSLVGFSKEHVQNADLVIATGAHGGLENIEVLQAKKRGIPVWTQGQAVGEFMKGEIFGRKFLGISIAGSHGKTTTTAMLATILKKENLDPSFLIGTGTILSLGNSGHFGKGKYFIAEADEYATDPKYDKTPKFLWQHPQIAIFTNIEFDHPDIFTSLEDIRNDFRIFANQLSNNGLLIACGDDPQIRILLKEYKGKSITFGFSPNNDYVIKKTTTAEAKTFFWITAYDTSLGEFLLNLSGEFNVVNALGAIITAVEIGLPIDRIKTSLLKFTGSKRRFEYIGKLTSGALIFDDYAHHPTEIKKTLRAFRQSFSKSKIVCIFQPHTYSRTKVLFDDFVHSFTDADMVILTDIYPSLREKEDKTVSSKLLVDKISAVHKDVIYLPKLDNVIKYIDQKRYGENILIITMGAGDIYKISEKLKIKS